jgi:hypothetical protein
MDDVTILKDLVPTLPQLRRLHYLISETESKYIAHCLDLDLVAVDTTVVAASRKLDVLVKDHIEFSLATGRLGNLNTKAPVQAWNEFNKAKPITLEPKEILITIPDAAQVVPLVQPGGVLAIDARQMPHATHAA